MNTLKMNTLKMNTLKIDNIKNSLSTVELYNIKKDLIKDIKTLSKNEHIQVFYIIKIANIKYTENNNGIFINLSNIDNKILNKLIKFVEYAKLNNSELETTNKMIDKIREENIKD